MEKRLVLRGALVGALAGLLAFLFARIFAEPKIQAAVGYESARDAAQDALDKAAGTATPPEGPELFSRTIQANLGIGVGMVAFGLAMGVLFAIAYTVCLGRVGSLRPRSIALAIAGRGVPGYLSRAVREVPGEPAVDWPRGHNQAARGAVPGVGRRVGAADGQCDLARPASARAARHVERHPDSRRGVRGRDRHRHVAAAGVRAARLQQVQLRQLRHRDAAAAAQCERRHRVPRFPGGSAVGFQVPVGRCAADPVVGTRSGVRAAGRTVLAPAMERDLEAESV